MRELQKSLRDQNEAKFERMRSLPSGMYHSVLLALEISDVVMSYMINDSYTDLEQLNGEIAGVITDFYTSRGKTTNH